MSRMDQSIFLISESISEDEIGNQIATPTERQVFAEEITVFGNEFYKAAVAGLKAEKRFQIYTREYQSEAKLKHNSTTYRIIRTETKGEKTRLTCERVIADG